MAVTTKSVDDDASARPLPTIVALSPIAERPPFVSESLPAGARLGDGSRVAPVEQEMTSSNIVPGARLGARQQHDLFALLGSSARAVRKIG